MFIDKFLDRSMPALQKALDLAWRRNQALTANIANAETPQYRAVDYHFGSELERAFGQSADEVSKTSPMHMDISANSSGHFIPDYSGMTKGDGNNVDIDQQMGKLSYNAAKYTQVANYIKKKFQLIESAIRTVG